MNKRFGFFCLPGRGHLYPATALGRRLESHGCSVTFFNRPITRAIVANAGLAFRQLVDDFEPDNAKTAAHNDRFIGPHPVSTIHAHASLVLRTALKAAADEHLDALLVDQADLAAGSVAEALGLPFINVSMFPPVYLNDDVPPFIYHWSPTGWRESQRRNKRRNDFFRLLFEPTLQAVNSSRMKWGLTPARDINELFSRTAIITQLPHVLDFTRTINVPSLFHTNSFYSDMGRPAIDFPWSRLNGKPIIYACMGTVRVESKKIYELIAAACAEFDVQLIMSLGGMSLTPELLRELPGDPIVVHFAPQMEVLRRSVLCITHAGLNTVLEAVANAVPLVAIPVTDDQPGVAARIEWSGIGRSLPFKRVTVEKLREAIGAALQNEACTTAVRRMQKDLESLDGLDMAADIIERVLR